MIVALRRGRILRSAFNLSRITVRCESDQQPAIFEDPNSYKQISKPTRVKPNFIFNEKPIERFFTGEFDFDLLEYPEIGSLVEVNYLLDFIKVVKRNVETIINLQEDDSLLSGNLPTRLENLGKLKLYGLRIARDDGGYEFCESEIGCIHETLIFDQALSKIIGENEDLGNLIIMKYGTEAQKREYLPKIASGEISTCFAHFETFPIVLNSHDKTKAYSSAQGESFTIVGKKTLVFNAHLADLIIVSANTTDLNENEGNDEVKQTFFLIDKNTSGVHISRYPDLISLNEDSFSEITFEKVVVPEDSIIGKIHQGDEIVKKVLSLGKFNIGPICSSVLKNLSNDAIEHNLKQNVFKQYMNDHHFMQREVAVLLREAYVIESMAYCLSGRLYWFKESDLFMESLIVKVMASEALYKGLQQYLQLRGSHSFKRKYKVDKLLSDSLFHQVYDDTNDDLKVTLSRQGLEHAKKHRKSDAMKKIKAATGSIMKNIFEKPSYVLDDEMIKGFIHPTLGDVGEKLFYEIQKFDEIVGKIIKAQKDESITIPESKYLKLADMVILIYATAATVGRASRSYCIGLRNCDTEVSIALSAASAFHRQFRMLEIEILNELEGKNPYKNVGSNILSKKKYVPVHPLTRR